MPSELAFLGGKPAISEAREDLFRWPILGKQDEEAVLETLRTPNFDDDDLILAFEREFADWLGAPFALSESSGTNAILAGLFACGVGAGDEVIVPACTYWATCAPVMTLKATPVFADAEEETMNISPDDIEKKITPRTRAIVVAHLLGYPCKMDEIMQLARRHGVMVVEDASHALGSLYKGRKVGLIGDVGAYSLCRKGLSVGEGGILVTKTREIYDRAIAWGHSNRFNHDTVLNPDLLKYVGLPLGGITSRMHVLSAALGRSQLARYSERLSEIDKAMTYFWELLEGIPGIHAHRPPKASSSTMGPWYNPHGRFVSRELSGLSRRRYIEAIRSEGFNSWTWGGISNPLHLHPLFQVADVYKEGKPTAIVHADRDARTRRGDLPITESLEAIAVPAFRRFDKNAIESYASAFIKVSRYHRELLVDH
jgi:perosamine synthetase